MKVKNIQSTNFERKQRFITPKMKEDIRFLLEKMNENTDYKDNEYYFKTTILKRLSNKKGDVDFIDGRMYIAKVPKEKQMERETLFTIGKTELVIDNKTGEIIDYNKSFFTTWKKIMNKIEENLEFFKNNFNNKEAVKQHKLSISGFTKKGWEKIEKIKADIK